MLLTESYRELQQKLHREDPSYATSGHRSAAKVASLMQTLQTLDVLDYGCGRRGLEEALGVAIRNYDPCIPGLDSPPEPAEIVVCSDVLEHIEPDCLNDVLSDLHRLTKRLLYVLIATRPALRALPDGRNAHLIQEGQQWWMNRLWDKGFRLIQLQNFVKQGHSVSFAAVLDKGE